MHLSPNGLHLGRRNGREVFFAANGFGPYPCVECGHAVSFADVNVHHINRDDTNHDPRNLAATHRGCHSTITVREREPASQESREKMRAAQQGRKRGPLSPLHRARLSAAKAGVARPDMVGDGNPSRRPEVRVKLQAAANKRWGRE